MRYVCTTLFDITATGITGHYKPTRGEFHDRAGRYINSADSWNYSRNQQRNWETVIQLISLRTQISEHTLPVKKGNMGEFEFEVEAHGFYDDGEDVVGVLKSDSHGVPMLTNLENTESIAEIIIISGENQNIWFSVIE
jgi:hypothetical protein